MDSSSTIKEAIRRHIELVEKAKKIVMPRATIAADVLLEIAKNGGRLFTCGNGGSAADSQHFAAEWVCRYKDDRRPLPAIALTTDTSALTAIANDYGFENIFSRPISALGAVGDVLVGFTTSGKSKNVLKAFESARAKKMKTIALTGDGGSGLHEVVDIAIVVPSKETARIQEVHEIIYHSWCEYVDANL